jgi:hypothetical protein
MNRRQAEVWEIVLGKLPVAADVAIESSDHLWFANQTGTRIPAEVAGSTRFGPLTMFALESEMTPHVQHWLEREGLQVRAEFVTPWGLCDLVAVSLRPEAVEHRLKLRQHRAITSVSRAAILMNVPDVETGESVSIPALARQLQTAPTDKAFMADVDRLVADRFLVLAARGRLQKLNGWMPMQERLVAVELKLARVDEALRQAARHMGFAQESYAAFPMPLARRIADRPLRWNRHFVAGVGLIGVQKHSCEILIRSDVPRETHFDDVQLYSVDKFWRTRAR